MNTSRLTAAALAALALAGSASAADVKIYGRADTGLIYQNYFGDSTKDDSFAVRHEYRHPRGHRRPRSHKRRHFRGLPP